MTGSVTRTGGPTWYFTWDRDGALPGDEFFSSSPLPSSVEECFDKEASPGDASEAAEALLVSADDKLTFSGDGCPGSLTVALLTRQHALIMGEFLPRYG